MSDKRCTGNTVKIIYSDRGKEGKIDKKEGVGGKRLRKKGRKRQREGGGEG